MHWQRYGAVLNIEPDGFTQRGNEYYCICPGHDDEHPSARVDPEKGAWYCDVCTSGGGLAALYAVIHQLDAVKDFDRIQQDLFQLLGIGPLDDAASKPSKAMRLIGLLGTIESFRTGNNETYVDLVAEGGGITTCPTQDVPSYCRDLLFQRRETAPKATITEAAEALEAAALHGQVVRKVSLRTARSEAGDVYVDLGRPDWKIAHISPRGVSIVDYTTTLPVRFTRAKGMLELPLPDATPLTIREIHKRFFNNLTPNDFLLVLGFIFIALREGQEYLILAVADKPGYGKTTLMKLVRRLIDPAEPMTATFPRNQQSLFAGLKNHYLPAWDNCSSIAPAMSDTLASITTGGGISERAYYTNFDEASFNGARPIVMTSVGSIVRRADLAGRVVAPGFRPFTDNGGSIARIPDEDLYAAFEQARPAILAFIYQAIGGGLRALPSVELPSSTRMLSSVKWIYSCMRAIGYHDRWFQAYQANQAGTDERLLDESPLTQPIISLLERYKNKWDGTASDLLEELNLLTPDGFRNPKWPKTAAHLSGELNQLAKALRQLGVSIEHPEHTDHSHARTIRLARQIAASPPKPPGLRRVI
jgi:hypothetical protein